jgi:hypothetical protein
MENIGFKLKIIIRAETVKTRARAATIYGDEFAAMVQT